MRHLAFALSCLILLPIGARSQSPEPAPSLNVGDWVKVSKLDRDGKPAPVPLIPTLAEARLFVLECLWAERDGKFPHTAGLAYIGHNTMAIVEDVSLTEDGAPALPLARIKISEGTLRGGLFWVPMGRLRSPGAPDPAAASHRQTKRGK